MKVKQILNGKTKKIAPMLLVIMLALAGGAAIATWILERQVTTTVTIIGIHDMELRDEVGFILGFINFGNLQREELKIFPEDPYYSFDNTGDYDLYVSYSLMDWPSSEIGIFIEVFDTGYGVWQTLGPDTIWERPVKHQGTDTFHWRITLNVDPDAVLDQTYTPTITWEAFDTVTG